MFTSNSSLYVSPISNISTQYGVLATMQKFCLQVSGDFACFTRPENKAERVSYDIITPSASRGVFEAVFWHPPVQWIVEKIEVLAPIQWMTVRRNEVSEVISTGTVKSAMKNGSGSLGLYIEEKRQQRASLLLKGVKYRLHARMRIREERLKADEKPGKFYAMFERRAKAGQVFSQPYLGCREFAAEVEWCESVNNTPPPINETRDLGWMLYDLDYPNPSTRWKTWGNEGWMFYNSEHMKPVNPKPMFFRARMEKGVVQVPQPDSEEVRR